MTCGMCPFLPNSLVTDGIFQENCSIDIFDYLFHFFPLLINFMHQHRHQQFKHWAQKTSASSGTAAGTAAAKTSRVVPLGLSTGLSRKHFAF